MPNRCTSGSLVPDPKSLVTFLTVGIPTPDVTSQCLNLLAENGATVLELGVPFSDPIADGKTIQEASHFSIGRHTTLVDTVGAVRLLRRHNAKVPAVIMSYTNTIRQFGANTFLLKMRTAGIVGMIAVDCPIETSGRLHVPLKANGVRPVVLASVTTGSRRLVGAAKTVGGFLYFASMQGTTGSELVRTQELAKRTHFLWDVMPVAVLVGFGIRNESSVRSVNKLSDGTVVGTPIVSSTRKGLLYQKVLQSLGSLQLLMKRLSRRNALE